MHHQSVLFCSFHPLMRGAHVRPLAATLYPTGLGDKTSPKDVRWHGKASDPKATEGACPSRPVLVTPGIRHLFLGNVAVDPQPWTNQICL
ncbi:hypothetical protein MUK42_35128 [Musa troglodytarum]|uniref:Uncharacterized protein n=1 Tax=Musa troglodytarum TaxID=320322 RepID=A0A9E7FDW5_9LILI|nr:hypothetical protein MUK42_35128 [Musa troglodytarum]